MAVSAPFCNVTVFTPPPRPVSPKGFRTLAANATLADVINVINNNFSPVTQSAVFNQYLTQDVTNVTNSTIRNTTRQEVGKLNFIQASIVRKRVKVVNPNDKEQFIIDDRVVSLTMRDSKTGASWTFSDKSA